MAKISVIVAVYNAEKYLRQCMDSIINQSCRDLEIICVNDGSTDGSLDILKEYENNDSRIKVYTKENEGLGGASARNYGLDRATGEYVSILDSDDFFDVHMLEKAVEKADALKTDIVVFGGYEYDERNGNTYKVKSILNEKEIPAKKVFSYKDCPGIYQLSQGMAWNKLYRRKFLTNNNVRFQKVKYTDDAYFTFANMVLAERIVVLEEYLCYYRVNSGISQTDGLNDYPDSSFVPYLALKKSLIEWGKYDEVKRSLINCETSFFRYFYDKITRYDTFEYLHNKFKNKIFKELDISDAPPELFDDRRVWLWTRQIMENSPGDMLLKSARAHGSDATTAIMRFQFPYRLIERQCRIALIGAGIMGRHYYSQLMLSGYCDVVCWAEQENPFGLSYISTIEDIKKYEFDYVVIAYMQQRLIDSALKLLESMGVSKDKIILGGEML